MKYGFKIPGVQHNKGRTQAASNHHGKSVHGDEGTQFAALAEQNCDNT